MRSQYCISLLRSCVCERERERCSANGLSWNNPTVESMLRYRSSVLRLSSPACPRDRSVRPAKETCALSATLPSSSTYSSLTPLLPLGSVPRVYCPSPLRTALRKVSLRDLTLRHAQITATDVVPCIWPTQIVRSCLRCQVPGEPASPN